MSIIHSLTIETGGVLLALSLVISGMVWVCVAIWPRKRRPDGRWDLEPTQTVERRYREVEGHE